MAHGFVCARNVVLVDGAVPKLTGFGLLSYSNDLYVPDHRRWQARELLQHMAGKVVVPGEVVVAVGEMLVVGEMVVAGEVVVVVVGGR